MLTINIDVLRTFKEMAADNDRAISRLVAGYRREKDFYSKKARLASDLAEVRIVLYFPSDGERIAEICQGTVCSRETKIVP